MKLIDEVVYEMNSKMNKSENSAAFTFDADSIIEARNEIAKYPDNRKQSAVMALLYIAQRNNDGWLSIDAMNYVADFLSMPRIKVYEIAHFYTMFNTERVGKYIIQVCRTTPCWLCGSDDIVQACEDALGIKVGETTEDGKFSLVEFECLGNCTNAPVLQVNDKFHERMTKEKVVALIDEIRDAV